MKKPFLIILFLLPFSVFAQAGKYILKGKIADLNSPAHVFLVYNRTLEGSAELHNGEFEIHGEIDQPTTAYLSLNKDGDKYASDNYVPLYLEPGTITLTSPDSLTKAKITGTRNNDANEEYKALMQPLDKRDDELYARDTNATEAQKSSVTFLKELQLLNKKLEDDKKTVEKHFILTHPWALVSLDVVYYYAYYSPYDEVKVLYDGLSPAVKNSLQGLEYAGELKKMESVSIGKIAPDFTLPDTSGHDISLSSFKGKYVLVDFWASWCPLCRQANPDIVKTYNRYKNRNFTILGVSLDKEGDRATWLKAIHHDNLSWTQVSELQFWQSKVVQLYHLTALPQNFLIDPNGKIIAHELTGEELATRLSGLLGN
jgi:peroxiredoxin